MILSFVTVTGLENCCITPAYLQWLFNQVSKPWPMGLLFLFSQILDFDILCKFSPKETIYMKCQRNANCMNLQTLFSLNNNKNMLSAENVTKHAKG